MVETMYRESAPGYRFHPDAVIPVLYVDVFSAFGAENEGFRWLP